MRIIAALFDTIPGLTWFITQNDNATRRVLALASRRGRAAFSETQGSETDEVIPAPGMDIEKARSGCAVR